jgi:hypothetical protein
MIVYGTAVEDGHEESFVETDEYSFQGHDYYIRLTAMRPYKDYARGRDQLIATIDFRNGVTRETGRFYKTLIDARNPAEANGHLRRHSTYRTLNRLLASEQPIPSPIFL